MSLKTTAFDKFKDWVVGEWETLEAEAAHGFNSFLELSKPIVAGIGPSVWTSVNRAFQKALSDVTHLDFTDVLPDVLTILANDGIKEGVHVATAELEALLTLLTGDGTRNPMTGVTSATAQAVMGTDVKPASDPDAVTLPNLGLFIAPAMAGHG